MYTAIALFAIAIMVCLQNFVKPNDWQKNEKPNEHKKKNKSPTDHKDSRECRKHQCYLQLLKIKPQNDFSQFLPFHLT